MDRWKITKCHFYRTAPFILGTPVINQTGLTQNFDINLQWNRNDPQHDGLKQALLDQLGLELAPSRQPIEVLVIEKAP